MFATIAPLGCILLNDAVMDPSRFVVYITVALGSIDLEAEQVGEIPYAFEQFQVHHRVVDEKLVTDPLLHKAHSSELERSDAHDLYDLQVGDHLFSRDWYAIQDSLILPFPIQFHDRL